jgi:nucleoside-specific outer membrane channel protein Tsx
VALENMEYSLKIWLMEMNIFCSFSNKLLVEIDEDQILYINFSANWKIFKLKIVYQLIAGAFL